MLFFMHFVYSFEVFGLEGSKHSKTNKLFMQYDFDGKGALFCVKSRYRVGFSKVNCNFAVEKSLTMTPENSVFFSLLQIIGQFETIR